MVNPKIWYIGYQSIGLKDTNSPDINSEHGVNIINFKNTPPSIKRYAYALSLLASNVQLFDKNDSLILYSNGSKIFNGKHRLVEGGDSLSYGSDWVSSPFAGNYYGGFIAGVYSNAMIALPSVKNNTQYYFISLFISKDTAINYKIVYSLVDMNLNGGKGKVIEKEMLVKYGNFAPAIEACKHGNGRDWWIITREYEKRILLSCY